MKRIHWIAGLYISMIIHAIAFVCGTSSAAALLLHSALALAAHAAFTLLPFPKPFMYPINYMGIGYYALTIYTFVVQAVVYSLPIHIVLVFHDDYVYKSLLVHTVLVIVAIGIFAFFDIDEARLLKKDIRIREEKAADDLFKRLGGKK